jgi:hypothetical protein
MEHCGFGQPSARRRRNYIGMKNAPATASGNVPCVAEAVSLGVAAPQRTLIRLQLVNADISMTGHSNFKMKRKLAPSRAVSIDIGFLCAHTLQFMQGSRSPRLTAVAANAPEPFRENLACDLVSPSPSSSARANAHMSGTSHAPSKAQHPRAHTSPVGVRQGLLARPLGAAVLCVSRGLRCHQAVHRLRSHCVLAHGLFSRCIQDRLGPADTKATRIQMSEHSLPYLAGQ